MKNLKYHPTAVAPVHDAKQQTSDEDTVSFYEDVIAGLTSVPKTLPCKYLYDSKGSNLFDQICDLAEYYPTRTEHKILQESLWEIADLVGPHAEVVEYGSGSGIKTRMLLEALHSPRSCTLIEISGGHLATSAAKLASEFPDIQIKPVCADYTKSVGLPALQPGTRRRVAFFPGSTIGNFLPTDAVAFLREVKRTVGKSGALIIGVDLKKPASILEPAYDDAEGVTAEFNLNLLERINRELGADIPVKDFCHVARYNEKLGRVEMHLQARCNLVVRLGNQEMSFDAGESIHTENSYKYSLEEFADFASQAGWQVEKVWTDVNDLFSVQYLTA